LINLQEEGDKVTDNHDALAKKSLSLAKDGKNSAAIELADSLNLSSASEVALKNLALAYSYAGALEKSEQCWLSAIGRFPIKSGYCYMLGSIQSQLSKNSEAMRSFECELKHALELNETYYLSSTVIKLSALYIEVGRTEDIKKLLPHLSDADVDHVPPYGALNKKKLLEMMKRPS
jgi:tetratricopeptide (TPR) repeat protein